MGITQRGLGEIGDIDNIHGPALARGASVEAGEVLLSLDWSGFSISEADELYHTVWDNVEGTKEIRLPINASVIEWNRMVLHDFDAVATEKWIVAVSVSVRAAETILRCLMDESQYRALSARDVTPHYGA